MGSIFLPVGHQLHVKCRTWLILNIYIRAVVSPVSIDPQISRFITLKEGNFKQKLRIRLYQIYGSFVEREQTLIIYAHTECTYKTSIST